MNKISNSSYRIAIKGANVWVTDTELVWRKAKIAYADKETRRISVVYEGETSSRDIPSDSQLLPCNDVSMCEVDDLTQLPHLHEASILHALNVRFFNNVIYTFTGSVLVAVNPFKSLPSLYSRETLNKYLQTVNNYSLLKSFDPHVFATAAYAYSALCRTQTPQTVLISGESGAGKTESTKFVMKFLVLAGTENINKPSSVEDRVLQSNPLLESLGNAKTLRNNNSSRFGKFIEMQFSLLPSGGEASFNARLLGASLEVYLLETVRVCQQLEGERNYHLFYQICAAATSVHEQNKTHYDFPSILSDTQVEPYSINLSRFQPVKQFRYLTKSSCYHLNSVDDLEEFERTLLAMQTIGIDTETKMSIFSIVGGVLNLGNLLFEALPNESEECQITESCDEAFDNVIHFLHLPSADELKKALTSRSITAGKESYLKPLTAAEAEVNRDALARALYGALFRVVVQRINESIGAPVKDNLFCGVLDIFGFECFKYNSFEQLCINYSNEKLQQFFNTFTFKCEQELYKKEDIEWNVSEYPDNKECVELLQRKRDGIFSLIHEECFVPRGNDRSLVSKLKERCKNHPHFGELKVKPDWFVIHHFAGSVPYCIDGFVEKNRDTLSKDLRDIVSQSENVFISSLLSSAEDTQDKETNKMIRKRNLHSLSSQFCKHLDSLMENVSLTEPHFIRCIKPNSLCVPSEFERRMVVEQLRYSGVLQVIEASRAGYAVHIKHVEFLMDFRCISNKETQVVALSLLSSGATDFRDVVTQMVNDLKTQLLRHDDTMKTFDIVVGKSLVFMKQRVHFLLCELREELRKAMANRISSMWKTKLQRRYYVHLKACTLVIQAHCRGYLVRKRLKEQRIAKAVRCIQCAYRKMVARREMQLKRESVLLLQAHLRRYLETMNIMNTEQLRRIAAERLQRWWRTTQRIRGIRRVCEQRRKEAHKRVATSAGDASLDVGGRVTHGSRTGTHHLNVSRFMNSSIDGPSYSSASVEQVKILQDGHTKVLQENVSLKEKLAQITDALERMKQEKELLQEKLIEAYTLSPSVDDSYQVAENATRAPSISGASPRSVDSLEPRKSIHKSIEHVVQLNLMKQGSPERSVPSAAHSRNSVDVTSSSMSDNIFETLESSLETTQNYIAWMQTKYATKNYVNAKTSDVSQCDVVSSVSCSDVGLIDVIIVAHHVGGVEDILDQDQTHFTYSHSIYLMEGTLLIYVVNAAVAQWRIGLVKYSEQPNQPLVPLPKKISSFLYQIILGSRAIVLAYSSAETASVRLVKRFATFLWARKINISISFWRTNVDCDAPDRFESRLKNLYNVTVTRDACYVLKALIRQEELRAVDSVDPTAQSDDIKLHDDEDGKAKSKAHTRQESFSHPSSSSSLSPESVTHTTLSFPDPPSHHLGDRQSTETVSLLETLHTGKPTRVSCLVFSNFVYDALEPFYLLAVGCSDGSLSMYRFYLDEDEKRMNYKHVLYPERNPRVSHVKLRERKERASSAERLWCVSHAHKLEIISMGFSDVDLTLFTSSIDSCVRVWGLYTGACHKNFQDTSRSTAFATMPLYPSRFVLANAKGLLRIVDSTCGAILQRIRLSLCVTSLTFNDIGNLCFAGSNKGTILVFSVVHPHSQLTLVLHASASTVPFTCLHFIPKTLRNPETLILLTKEGVLQILTVVLVNGVFLGFVARHTLKTESSSTSSACYCHRGAGYLVTPGFDGAVHLYSTHNYVLRQLQYHKTAVTSVACNCFSTLMASGDKTGHISLWRLNPIVV